MEIAETKLKVKRSHDLRVNHGHPWIFSNEIENFSELKSLEKGSLVMVQTKGEDFALAYFNSHSLIAARILSYNVKDKIDHKFFVARITEAKKLREKFFPKPFYRLIHSEADFLPGLIIDRFGDYLVCQISTAGMENLSEILISALEEIFPNASIIFRNDVDSRRLEGLENYSKIIKGDFPSKVTIEENDITYSINIKDGQKTGWFFDQRINRDFVASISKDADVLDAFCYLGGFGFNALKGGAKSVTFLDSSESAILEVKEKAQNLENIDIICDKVFDYLEAQNQRKFDVVLLDPPAFIKSKKDLFTGMKGYEKLIRLGARSLKKGGILMISSCSHHASLADLISMASNAFRKSNRQAKIIRTFGAGFDHPLHPALKESEYLKSISFLVE
jgi:23S rRNA (cytosine1962-C5)-methyltransferase